MDEVIFEEFKGTGNMEVHLDRHLVDRRIFQRSTSNSPARVRKNSLSPAGIQQGCGAAPRADRRAAGRSDGTVAHKLKKTKSNIEFLLGMAMG